MLDCFNDNEMFFGGCNYKYNWNKHYEEVNKKISKMKGLDKDKIKHRLNKLDLYKKFDGHIFTYDIDYPCNGCMIKTNKGDKVTILRNWCEKIEN